MTPPRIRRMTAEDLDAVCALDAVCMPPGWPRETFAGELASLVGAYYVAERDGRILGYLGGSVILDEAHISTFGVAPGERRKGVGERLLVAFLRSCLGMGVRRITLEVREGNEPAQALYRKYGFAPVSRRHAYYEPAPGASPAAREDALVMWIDDTSRLGFRSLLAERMAALTRTGEEA